MTTAVLPGTFDPITLGHLDLVRRASGLAGRVVVAVGVHAGKRPLLPLDVRVDLVRRCVEGMPGVTVQAFDGLLVDLCRALGAELVVKGVRDASDLSWELTQAAVNREIGDVETALLPTRPELAHVSSSIVRELASYGMDVSRYVPAPVARVLADNGGTGTAPRGGRSSR